MSRPESVANLLLDEANPRFHESVTSQVEAIAAILRDDHKKLLNLARDIAERGALNPTEVIIVAEGDNDDLVVLEGNRRVAALKLLKNPELASAVSKEIGVDLVKHFAKLGKDGRGPDRVEVHEVDSREDARHWLELRHTGENDGVGILRWQSWQTNNFRRRRGRQADRGAVFCDAVDRDHPSNQVLRDYIDDVRTQRLTTLGRLVSDPEIRRDFGFDFIDHELVFYFSASEMRQGLELMFGELATGDITVTDVKTKVQRAEYVKARHAILPRRENRRHVSRKPGEEFVSVSLDLGQADAASTISGGGWQGGAANKVDSANDAGSGGGVSASPGGASSSVGAATGDVGKTSSRKKSAEDKVIFAGVRFSNLSPKVSSMIRQTRRISVEDMPQVAGVLLRVILELVVTEGIAAGVVGGKEGDSLKAKIRNALLALDDECANPMKRNKSLEMAWTRTQDPDGMAVQSMHSYVHGVYGDPTAAEVRNYSTAFKPLVSGIDELIGSKS